MECTNKFDIAIIGAGFSGTVALINLLRKRWAAPLTVALIDRCEKEKVGLGLAYSTKEDTHYLNVQAGNMSALSDDPSHLVRYLQGRNNDANWSTFITRGAYGRYVQDTLSSVSADGAANNVTVTVINADITDVNESKTEFQLFSGHEMLLAASRVILALGNPKPVLPHVISSGLFGSAAVIADPWNNSDFARISNRDDILFIGSGLTMVDKALELVYKKHSGRLIAVSRHGLLPQSHIKELLVEGYPEVEEINLPMRARETVGAIRKLTKKVPDWRLVIDGLRPYTNKWWQSLGLVEKKRYLRHLQPYWDTFRHRMAPEVGERIADLLANGRLKIEAGKIVSVSEHDQKIVAKIQRRGTKQCTELVVDKIVNCTGPSSDLRKTEDRLLHSLLAKGLISPNELRSGILIDEHFHAVSADGKANDRLTVVGPLLRGNFFETIAVPELRKQADELSQCVYEEIMSRHVVQNFHRRVPTLI
jgi:uncharacterized NAD(P)/FAD-binding protein YdhS